MAQFSATLHTRQWERYVTLRFLVLLGGSFTSFFMTIALAIPPLTVKNRGGGGVRLGKSEVSRGLLYVSFWVSLG